MMALTQTCVMPWQRFMCDEERGHMRCYALPSAFDGASMVVVVKSSHTSNTWFATVQILPQVFRDSL